MSIRSEYVYGCEYGALGGTLNFMTTRHAPKSAAVSVQPAGRAVTAGLLLAVLAGIAWLAGMIYTVSGWAQ